LKSQVQRIFHELFDDIWNYNSHLFKDDPSKVVPKRDVVQVVDITSDILPQKDALAPLLDYQERILPIKGFEVY
jgi:hypothetical protein